MMPTEFGKRESLLAKNDQMMSLKVTLEFEIGNHVKQIENCKYNKEGMPLCNWFTSFVRIKPSKAHDVKIENIVEYVEFKLPESFPNGKVPKKVFHEGFS